MKVESNFKLNKKDYEQFILFLNNNQMSMTTFFEICAKKIIETKKIPFKVTWDDFFYCDANIKFLNRGIRSLKKEKGIIHKTLDELEETAND